MADGAKHSNYHISSSIGTSITLEQPAYQMPKQAKAKQGALKELGQKPMQNVHKRTLRDYTDAILRDPKRVCVDIALDDPASAVVYFQYRNGLERLSAAAYARTLKEGNHSAPEVIAKTDNSLANG